MKHDITELEQELSTIYKILRSTGMLEKDILIYLSISEDEILDEN